MNANEFDTAIREELRAQAGQTPNSAATKAAVLRAVDGQLLSDRPGLGRWLTPMLAAAAVVLVAVGLTVGPRLIDSHRPEPSPAGRALATPLPRTPRSAAGPTADPSSDPTATRSSRSTAGGPAIPARPQQPTPCPARQLQVTGTPLSSRSGDAAGLRLVYTNTGSRPCTLSGYPGAAAVTANGATLGDAARVPSGFFGGLGSAGTPPRVTVAASGKASAVIEWEAASYSPSTKCYQAAGIASTPPGTTATQRFGTATRYCNLQVHPVVTGSSGRG